MIPTSSAYAATANIERVRRDNCKIGFVFVLADNSPMNAVSTQTFELSFADESGLSVVTVPLVATLANRLEATLSDAVRGKLSKSRYTYSLYNATLARTEVVGTFTWVRGSTKAAGLFIAPDFQVVYTSVASIVINGLVVMDNTAPFVEAARASVFASKQAVDQIKGVGTGQATEAASSATNAANAASTATTKAGEALAAANAAAGSASTATTKAGEAVASANAAATARDAAQAAALNKAIAAGSVNTSLTIDVSVSDNIVESITLTANTTLSITNGAFGKSLTLIITQGGAGSFTLTLPAACKTPGSAAIDWNTASGAVNVISMVFASATYIVTTSLKM